MNTSIFTMFVCLISHATIFTYRTPFTCETLIDSNSAVSCVYASRKRDPVKEQTEQWR